MNECFERMPIENLVPLHLRDLTTVDEFLNQLSTCDEHYHHLLNEAKISNEVLCYIGHISYPFQNCHIGLKR